MTLKTGQRTENDLGGRNRSAQGLIKIHPRIELTGKQIIKCSMLLEIMQLIGSGRNIERITNIMTDFYDRQIYLTWLCIISITGISAYLQVILDFQYVFTIGYALSFGVAFLIGRFEELNFKNNAVIKEVDPNTVLAIRKAFDSRYYESDSKIKNFISTIVSILIAFSISFLLNSGE